MIYALQQIIVISANKNIYPPEVVPYLQLLSKHAFGNYKNLLKEMTLSSQMGNPVPRPLGKSFSGAEPTGSQSCAADSARRMAIAERPPFLCFRR